MSICNTKITLIRRCIFYVHMDTSFKLELRTIYGRFIVLNKICFYLALHVFQIVQNFAIKKKILIAIFCQFDGHMVNRLL